MAFDAAGFDPKIVQPVIENDAQKVIGRARTRLARPTNWIKGQLCAGEGFCILGALSGSGGFAAMVTAETCVERAIRDLGFRQRMSEIMPGADSDTACVAVFNDHRATSHADVLAVLDRAYELAASPA